MRRCRPRRILLLLSTLLFVYGFYMGGLQYVISRISVAFMIDESKQGTGIGILIAVPHVISLFFPILMGAVADKMGKKKILLLFVCVFAVGCGICSGSGSMLVYLIGVTMVGIGHSVCESVSTAVLSDLNPDNSARNINISQGFLSAGAVLGPVLIRWLMAATNTGWRTLFVVSGIGFLVMFVFLITSVFPAPRTAEPWNRENDRKLSLRGSAALVCCMVAMMLYVSLEKGIANFAESHFSADFLRDDLAAYAISLFWGGMTVSRLVMSLRMKRLSVTLMIHFGITAVLLGVLHLSGLAYLSLTVMFLIGFASAPLWSGLVALATKQHPEHSGAISGLMSSAGSVGSTVSPLLIGVVSDKFGVRSGFLLLSAFAIFGGSILLFTNSRKKPKKTA